ncbi:MAG: hypothetical protein MUO85_07910 [candidate division Zixibacteria bacterium]|nr:hypothetical protein [candidate division Zixibacteria bacterium]
MKKFYFDVRDIFRAPRLALCGKKLPVQFLGFLIGYLGYLILTYFAYLSEGASLAEIWKDYGLFPVYEFFFGTWYSQIIFILGLLFMIACWLLSSAMVAKITYEQLKGDGFYSKDDAWKFIRKYWKPVLLSPFSLAIFFIILAVAGIIVGLIGKIPIVGELGLGFFYIFPIFIVAIFAVYLFLIFLVSLLLVPAIVATTKEETFESIIQSFSTVWNQPWRYFLYTGLLGFLAKLGMFIFGYFAYLAVVLINWCSSVFMDDKLGSIFLRALDYLRLPDTIGSFFTNLYPGSGIYFLTDKSMFGFSILWRYHLPWSYEISAFLIGISLVLITFAVISYGLTILSTGQTLIYIILRKKKDDEDLLEKKPEIEEGAKEEKKE